MTFEPGDVVTVPFPFSDLSATKVRPALVISSRSHNEGPDLVVCAITSNTKDSVHTVLFEPGDMSKPQVPRASRVKVGKLATIHKDLVRTAYGRLKPDAMAQVWKEFHALFPRGN